MKRRLLFTRPLSEWAVLKIDLTLQPTIIYYYRHFPKCQIMYLIYEHEKTNHYHSHLKKYPLVHKEINNSSQKCIKDLRDSLKYKK